MILDYWRTSNLHCYQPSITQNKLLLKSESAETGSSTEEIACTFQKLSGNDSQETLDGWKIAFNAKYLI